MGLFRHFSSSRLDDRRRPRYWPTPETPRLPNPDPANYKIIKSAVLGCFLVVLVNYPDCANYEGNKILVFENTSLEELMTQKLIDPHFSNSSKYKHPIARFEPTKRGWILACSMCILG